MTSTSTFKTGVKLSEFRHCNKDLSNIGPKTCMFIYFHLHKNLNFKELKGMESVCDCTEIKVLCITFFTQISIIFSTQPFPAKNVI